MEIRDFTKERRRIAKEAELEWIMDTDRPLEIIIEKAMHKYDNLMLCEMMQRMFPGYRATVIHSGGMEIRNNEKAFIIGMKKEIDKPEESVV